MDSVPQKRCSRCGESKPLADFARNKNSRDGLQPRCKSCNCEWHRVYYAEHKAHPRVRIRKLEPHESKTCNRCGHTKPVAEFRGHKRTDGDGHYNQCRECERAYHRSAQPLRREWRRLYDKTHRDRIYAKQKEWRQRNRERHIASRRRYWRSEKGRLYNRVRAQMRRIRKSEGAPVTVEQVQALMAQQKRCYYCRRLFTSRRKPTLDHVIPLSKGGSHDISNLVLACRTCNAKKYNRLLRLI